MVVRISLKCQEDYRVGPKEVVADPQIHSLHSNKVRDVNACEQDTVLLFYLFIIIITFVPLCLDGMDGWLVDK